MSVQTGETVENLTSRLKEPFNPNLIEWRPQGKPYNGKVRVVPYIDARLVMKRLTDVLGVTGWSDSYKTILTTDREVVVECTIKVGDCVHSDVGEAMVEERGYVTTLGAAMKAAYSDSIKRAAVHFGVGSYLYALPAYNVPCNDRGFPKDNFLEDIDLPDFAIPKKKTPQQNPQPNPFAPTDHSEPKPVAKTDSQNRINPPQSKPAHRMIPWDKATSYIDRGAIKCQESTATDAEHFESAAYKIIEDRMGPDFEEGCSVPEPIMKEIEMYFASFLDN